MYRSRGMWLSVVVVCGALAACGREPVAQSQPGGAGAATLAPRPTSGSDWTGFQGGGALVGMGQGMEGPKLRLRWRYKTDPDESAGVEGAAAIVGDTVYVADSRGFIHAVGLADGKVRWKYSSYVKHEDLAAEGDGAASGPATLPTATGPASAPATAAATEPAAEETGGGFETTPLVVGGGVYAGDLEGVFHGVSAKDGHRLWKFEARMPIHASANAAGGGKHVVFGTDGSMVYCLKAENGESVWESRCGDRVNSCPSVAGGGKGEKVYVSGCDGLLRVFDGATGDGLGAGEIRAIAPGSTAVLSDRAVVGTGTGHVLCFDLADMSVKWDFDGIEDGAMVYASPATDGKVAVIGARDRNVYALDLATGKAKWVFKTRGEVDSSPVICGKYVYVGSRDKRLYAIELETGKEAWSFTASRAISAPVAIGRGVLVVSDMMGNVYCFENGP